MTTMTATASALNAAAATTQTAVLLAYHDGEAHFRLIETAKGLFILHGQLVRNARTGRFCKLSDAV